MHIDFERFLLSMIKKFLPDTWHGQIRSLNCSNIASIKIITLHRNTLKGKIITGAPTKRNFEAQLKLKSMLISIASIELKFLFCHLAHTKTRILTNSSFSHFCYISGQQTLNLSFASPVNHTTLWLGLSSGICSKSDKRAPTYNTT